MVVLMCFIRHWVQSGFPPFRWCIQCQSYGFLTYSGRFAALSSAPVLIRSRFDLVSSRGGSQQRIPELRALTQPSSLLIPWWRGRGWLGGWVLVYGSKVRSEVNKMLPWVQPAVKDVNLLLHRLKVLISADEANVCVSGPGCDIKRVNQRPDLGLIGLQVFKRSFQIYSLWKIYTNSWKWRLFFKWMQKEGLKSQAWKLFEEPLLFLASEKSINNNDQEIPRLY